MAEPFLAEIRMMSFAYAPTSQGWALCNGQLLPINQNQALFSLLGTTYRRQWADHFRAARSAGTDADSRRQWLSSSARRAASRPIRSPRRKCPSTSHVLNGSTANASAIGPGGNVLARGTTAVGANPINYYSTTLSNFVAHAARDGRQHRRQPAASQHAAVPDHQLLHRPAGHFPVAELRKPAMAQPYVGEIRMFAGNFAPAGWKFCDGTLLRDLRERDPVSVDRHHLWRRRREHVRRAGPARPDPGPPG